MATIYISYKLEERGLAQQVAQALERHGHRAVYDAVALSPGEDWRRVLLDALHGSDAIVLLLTERSLASPFVLGELGAARALFHSFGQMLILPVLVGDMAVPPVVSDLFVVRMAAGQDAIEQAADEILKALTDHLARSRRGHPRIFISHRHHDVAIAQALVRVIEASFDVGPSDLRCTSVHPYKLRAGDRTGDRLRTEIRRAEAVIGILTPDTKASSYVLFELGASWGRGGVTFPLLARGASLADVPAPIGDLHTISLEDEAECHQLVDDLADVTSLSRQEKQGAAVSQRIDELVALARDAAGGKS
ncbi:MAG: toll/interleukin-1 receptor domain-containing protein [Pyrinomonadaceae bacterium]